jgi:diacylglycerol kinase (ATP)
MQQREDKSPHKSKSGLVRIIRAFGYSLEGFATAIKHEHAFRQELILCLVLLPFAILLPFAPLERVVLIASLLIVLIVELLNSAIEAIVDRVSLENHALSKRAKDLGSAAVFLALVVVALAWGLIAGPVLLAWLKSSV